MPLDGTSATAGGETAPGVATFSHPVRRWASDDINYFFHRQQVERSRAATAPSAAARAVHRRLAQLYEEAIEQVTEGKVRFRRASVNRATRASSHRRGGACGII